MLTYVEVFPDETFALSCVDGSMIRRPPISSTGGGSAVAVHAGAPKRWKRKKGGGRKPKETSTACGTCGEPLVGEGTVLVRCGWCGWC